MRVVASHEYLHWDLHWYLHWYTQIGFDCEVPSHSRIAHVLFKLCRYIINITAAQLHVPAL